MLSAIKGTSLNLLLGRFKVYNTSMENTYRLGTTYGTYLDKYIYSVTEMAFSGTFLVVNSHW